MMITDDEERAAAYAEINKEIVDLCPTIWACDVSSTFVYRSSYIEYMPVAADYENGVNAIYSPGYTAYFMNYRLA